ncbi:hypothetical protein LX16_2997 [Stackebrandtia albiflava]|uniref:Uncharacterized protein n=1 Tax=Stackebrandtia albiflava TaxID=406432 RepID=A0A562V348_9ACTN|nr:hypothetical protein [Stackebrandtia albiflava]TWJ12242.1 hypothetical protein LX16_2997 [Stackebrandtia albiflava]
MSWDPMGKAAEVQKAAMAALKAEKARDQVRGRQDVHPGPPAYDDTDFLLIAALPAAFAWLEPRDPSGLLAKAAALESASDTLKGASTGTEVMTTTLLTQFSSSTVHAFCAYAGKMGRVSVRQHMLAGELANAARNIEGYLRSAAHDVDDAADKAIKALHHIETHGSGTGGDSLRRALAGTVLGVLGAAVPASRGVSVLFALIDGIQGVIGTTAPETGPDLGGDTIGDVVANLVSTLTARRRELSDLDDEISGILEKDAATVAGLGEKLCPSRQLMSDGRGDLRPEPGGILADLGKLYFYATDMLPTLASEFAAANRSVAAAHGGGPAMGPAAGVWDALCLELQQATGNTADNLHDAADVLERAALDFGDADGFTRTRIEESADDARGIVAPDEIYDPRGDEVLPVIPDGPSCLGDYTGPPDIVPDLPGGDTRPDTGADGLAQLLVPPVAR